MFQEAPYLPMGEATPLTHTLEILIMLMGAFAFGVLLGWALWYRYKKMAAASGESSEQYRVALETLQKEQASLRYRFDELDKDNEALRINLHRTEADRSLLEEKVTELENQPTISAATVVEAVAEVVQQDTNPETAVQRARVVTESLPPLDPTPYEYDQFFAPTDLRIFRGVDGATAVALAGAGFENWESLSKAKVKELKPALALMDRAEETDPLIRQAKLAQAGKWSELLDLQNFLEPKTEDTPLPNATHLETYYLQQLGFARYTPDDLQIVEGIGATTEGLLRGAGISNWQQLADSSGEKIRSILDKAGSRTRLARPETWPRQARLALNGDWAKLKAYQDVLQGKS